MENVYLLSTIIHTSLPRNTGFYKRLKPPPLTFIHKKVCFKHVQTARFHMPDWLHERSICAKNWKDSTYYKWYIVYSTAQNTSQGNVQLHFYPVNSLYCNNWHIFQSTRVWFQASSAHKHPFDKCAKNAFVSANIMCENKVMLYSHVH